MAVDLEQVMILLQRRCNSVREIKRITEELLDAFVRNDQVAANILLEQREEEMSAVDSCTEAVWLLAEKGGEEAETIRSLMNADPPSGEQPRSFEEEKIYEIRRKTKTLIKSVQEMDRRMSLKVAGGKSYYSEKSRQTGGQEV